MKKSRNSNADSAGTGAVKRKDGMMQELPDLTSSSYTTSNVDLYVGAEGPPGHDGVVGSAGRGMFFGNLNLLRQGAASAVARPQLADLISEELMNARIVKVYIADPNENLPLDKRVLYRGEEKLTDLTDQELFFELGIADLLKKHNDVRAKTQDRKQSEKFGREIFLEPARIRDLKMVVVNIASF